MKIKIISDGTSHGTKVINADTEEMVEGVVAVEWKVRADEDFATAHIEFENIPVELEAEFKDKEVDNTCTDCGVIISPDSEICTVCKDRE